MEDKRRDSSGTPPTPSIESTNPPMEPSTSSRRRGGGHKRKLASINNSSGGSGGSDPQASSSKRQARDKPPAVPLPPIHLNGPCTRARLQPNGSSDLSELVMSELKVETDSRDGVAHSEDLRGMSVKLAVLEESLEMEYESTMSRDANVHVVPIHAGWFSWTKIHPLEEMMMPSFFNGKSENRTPDIYMEIRNWILRKFHQNPSSQFELEQLSDLAVGDSDARQDVMEFLDYWGVINYHPFRPNKPNTDTVGVENDEEARENNSLLEKLFQLETMQSMTPVVTRTDTEIPTMSSGLLPESVIAEELLKPEGSDVGYHCNSCSTDCSRKRYHCQKQADFDLCAECFNDGKFGTDMSPLDFILMEPAEAGSVNGGKWTDQENLLLLEAIELFRDNWSEIAEHVATKTKAQCILHFVQMPIEDIFCNSDDENVFPKEIGLPVSLLTEPENSSPKSGQDMDTENKVVSVNTESQGGGSDNQTLSCQMKSSNPEEVDNTLKSLDSTENFVLKALKDAFEYVGSLNSPGEKLCFAEAGNPVMTLASFLVRIVEPNIATASIQSSLKALSLDHSSEELSARHCFRLEDPPDDMNNLPQTDGAASGSINVEAQKVGDESEVKQTEGPSESVVDGVCNKKDKNDEDKDNTSREHNLTDTSLEPKHVASSSNERGDKIGSHNGFDGIVAHEEACAVSTTTSDFPQKQAQKCTKASVSELEKDYLSNHLKESANGALAESQDTLKYDDLASFSEKKENDHMVVRDSVAEKEENAGHRDAKASDDEKNPSAAENYIDINKLERVAVTALSAAAMKAKLLADQEEDQIRHLAVSLVEKQLYKLETKLAFFSDLENVVIRVKGLLDRSKHRLFEERAQIIAARLGMQALARPTAQQTSPNKAAANFLNQVPRPMIGMNALRPPISRPTLVPNFASNHYLMPGRTAGSSIPPNFDNLGTS